MDVTGRRIVSLSRTFIRRSLIVFPQHTRRVYRPLKNQFQQVKKYSGLLLTLPVSLIPSVMAASGEDNKALIEQSEELYNKNAYMEMYDLLIPHKDKNDADVLWRVARACVERGKIVGGEEKKALTYQAFELIKKALELDDNNFACHKWYGILLDYTGEYEGNKKRIANAFLCKEHFIKASELNPKDAVTYYCIGYWCFLFADMAWYERKIASMLFASPPTSTYDEALGYFRKAEETEPGFYNQNKLMLGKTLLRLKNKAEAKPFLQQAADIDPKTKDDEKSQEEAKQLLKSC